MNKNYPVKRLSQRTLDAEMLNGSRSRYLKKILDAKKRGMESTTQYGRRIISASVEAVANLIRESIEQSVSDGLVKTAGFAAMFLHDKDEKKLAAITCRGVLDMVSANRTFTSVAISIGRMVSDEVIAENMKVMEKPSFNMWKQILDRNGFKTTPKRTGSILRKMATGYKLPISGWTQKERLIIGTFLIDCFIRATGLVEIKNLFIAKRKTQLYLVPTRQTAAWIADYNNWAEIMEPTYLPMVVKPMRWKSGEIYGGGYDIVGARKEPLVKSQNRKFLNSIMGVRMDEVVDAINKLQETAFKINKRVFSVMMDFWNAGQFVGDLVVYKEIPLPTRPNPDTTPIEDVKAYYREVATIHGINDSNRSRSLQASKVLYVADKLKDEERIYFPHQVDFRGRAYPIPPFLNPQGTDLAKSLLLFSNGKPIKNEKERDWLLIYGANLWGLDKKPFSERIDWVVKNSQMIHSIAKNPNEDRRWTEADSPWLFLAFCFEFAEFANRGFGYVSHLPISLDATNNGLQILSLLTRDEVGAKYTNVTNGEKPEDIYAFVAEKTTDALGRIATETALCWKEFGINRKSVKKPVMTLAYGLSLYSCRKYIEDWYLDEIRGGRQKAFPTKDINKKTQFLATEVWRAMDIPIGRAKKAMAYIQKLANTCSNNGVPFRWVSPSGMPCVQEYLCQKAKRVQLYLNGVFMISPKINIPTTKLNQRKQRSGASPNVIHSYDAACLHKSVNSATKFGVDSFMMIHDSYGVLAADVEKMLFCAKKSFIDVFSIDQLRELRRQVAEQLPVGIELPEPPEYGNLDVQEMADSSYFMS